MQKLLTLYKHSILYGKRYAFVGTFIVASLTCYKFSYWEPPPNVGLEFDAGLVSWMRPDFGLPDDLKKMGFEKPSKMTIGLSTYDMLLGWLHNRGHKDTENVEIKIPTHGTLRFMRVSGYPDSPEILSRDEAVVVPDQYVRLGALRA